MSVTVVWNFARGDSVVSSKFPSNLMCRSIEALRRR
jgi:hypothetical protein